MQVIATAGHVDHGKSTLVRALTGMEPDRWAEERRRGMTIDLGYAWTRLPSGRQVAFVDVPGHERFTTNMLAGVGPVPAVLLVIAADDGWRAQTEEHVLALNALGVRLGVMAVTRSDLADPAPATEQARARLAATSLAGIPAVSVSGTTGDGLERLRTALDALADAMPQPHPEARVRLWVDRSFTIRGSGTVVTGTLGAGTLRTGDVLDLGGARVTIRALQCLGEPFEEVGAPARVAVNLRGLHHDQVRRGDALLTPGAWRPTRIVDVRFDGRDLPSHAVIHVGSAAMPAVVRRIGAPDGTEPFVLARLGLDSPLPLAVGDRLLIRDPGRRHILGGATALDRAPPDLRRRGAARARAANLRDGPSTPDLAAEIRRRRFARRELLLTLGVPVPEAIPAGVVAAGDWLVDQGRWEEWRSALHAAVDAPEPGSLVDTGFGHGDLVRTLGLPDGAVLDVLLRTSPELESVAGRVRRRGAQATLRADLEALVSQLTDMLRHQPFNAPEQDQLAELGLGRHELGAAARAGAILRLPGDIVLLPAAPQDAAALLRTIPQPFTLSAARQALTTTRRVAVPLLEHMDRLGVTERIGEGLRRLRN